MPLCIPIPTSSSSHRPLLRIHSYNLTQAKGGFHFLRVCSQVLPEEAVSHRIVVAEATREEFLQQLCASSAFLLSSLEQIAAGPLGAEIIVQVPAPLLYVPDGLFSLWSELGVGVFQDDGGFWGAKHASR